MIKSVQRQLTFILALFAMFWAVASLGLLQVSKGARFHQLNSLHLKYSFALNELVGNSKGAVPDLDQLEQTIGNIRRQPQQCLLAFNAFDRLLVKMIGTSIAVQLCVDDIQVADQMLATIQSYRGGQIDDQQMQAILRFGAQRFVSHSAEFEQPITKTVNFMFASSMWIMSMVGFAFLILVFAVSRRVARSVIEVEQINDALRASESMMALVMRSVPLGICYFDTAERYRFCNVRHQEFLGHRGVDLTGKTIREVVDGSIYADIKPNVVRALDGETVAFEASHVNHAGENIEVFASYTPHIGPQGKIDGVFVVLQDIAGRKRAEDALKASERRLRSAFDSIQAGSIIIDETGAIEIFNAAAEKIFGYSAAEMVGHNVRRLMPEPHRERHDSYLAGYLRTGKARIIGSGREMTGLRKNGEEFPLHLGVGEMVVGGERSFIGSVVDLTKLKNLEAQLRQSQRMEAVGQLTGGVAHDFNNLLAIMSGNLELAQAESASGTPSRRRIDTAMAAIKRASALTSQLLAFSRKQTLAPAYVHPHALLKESLSLLQRTIGEDIAISVSQNAPEKTICIDVGMFGNALLNLVLNAKDAMPRGGDLAIETGAVDLHGEVFAQQEAPVSGPHLRISVSDNGSGIRRADMARIFEPFFTTKEVGQGSGLGLSMVYGFVKQSGGHLSVKSTWGKGTEVQLFFPFVAAAVTTPENSHPAPTAEEPSERTILLVEDDDDLRATTKAILEHLGCTVLQAADGASALAVLEQRSGCIDLLLSDVVMPGGMSGLDLARKVEADYPGVRVMLTSGYPQSVDQAGFLLLKKPYGMQQLSQALRDIFHGQAARSR